MRSEVSSFNSDVSQTSRKSFRKSLDDFKMTFKGSLKRKRNLQNATISHLKGSTSYEKEKMRLSFETAEYYSMLASAISGGIESPIQFITQVNGYMKFREDFYISMIIY